MDHPFRENQEQAVAPRHIITIGNRDRERALERCGERWVFVSR